MASWDAQAALYDVAATFAVGKVYASVDALAQSLREQKGALAGADEFLPWEVGSGTIRPPSSSCRDSYWRRKAYAA